MGQTSAYGAPKVCACIFVSRGYKSIQQANGVLKKYSRAAGERSHAVKVEAIISRRVFGAERRAL